MTHFNDIAKNWDDEGKIKMMKNLAVETLSSLSLNEKKHILDFGCGTGLFGLEFSDYAKTLTGIDTSSGMLEIFDKKTEGDDSVQSINIDLENEQLKSHYDLIISSMAFHHLDSPSVMLQKLKGMLSSGGCIAIVDLDEEDGSFHPDNNKMGVKHFGFSKQTLETWAKEAAMTLDYRIIHSLDKNNKSYQIFLAVFSLPV